MAALSGLGDRTDGPYSDIDLLVVLDDAPHAERRRLMVKLRRATRAVTAPHDLLVTSVDDFERDRASPATTEFEPAQHGALEALQAQAGDRSRKC